MPDGCDRRKFLVVAPPIATLQITAYRVVRMFVGGPRHSGADLGSRKQVIGPAPVLPFIACSGWYPCIPEVGTDLYIGHRCRRCVIRRIRASPTCQDCPEYISPAGDRLLNGPSSSSAGSRSDAQRSRSKAERLAERDCIRSNLGAGQSIRRVEHDLCFDPEILDGPLEHRVVGSLCARRLVVKAVRVVLDAVEVVLVLLVDQRLQFGVILARNS